MQARRVLRSTTALALIAFGGAAGSGLPARAACVTTGATTACDALPPNPVATTVGGGRTDHGRTVVLGDGAAIEVSNRNGISLGDDARITLRSGSAVRGDQNSGGGNYGTGNNLVEFNSNGRLLIEAGASIVKTGTEVTAEGVNVHGFGNRIENHGSIVGNASAAAIWFEDTTTGTKNVVDNFGLIRRVGGGAVMGTNGGAGIQFFNETAAVVDGDLRFAGGDDDLFFSAGSSVTGAINGGGGTNTLTLRGALGSSDTLRGDIANFATLTKDGLGRWTVPGSLSGFTATTVRLGTLALTGDNANLGGSVTVMAAGVLEARAQSLPVQADPAENVANVMNDGLVRFAQPDDGTYVGQIVGAGRVEKTGAGVLTLAPSVGAGNSYAGGTSIDEGTVAVAADSALGAAVGGLSLDSGVLRTTESFTTGRATLLEAGGGVFETVAGTALTHAGAITGGGLVKAGAGTLVLAGSNGYVGGTAIVGGVLEVDGDARLGAAAGGLDFDGGVLRTTADTSIARTTTIEAGGGGFEVAAGTSLGFTGTISGPGALAKSGAGRLVVTGSVGHSGGTTIAAGTLQIGEGGTSGALAGDVVNDGLLVVDRADSVTLAGRVSGSGALRQAGGGTTTLTAANGYAGATEVAAGRLLVNGDQSAATGATSVAAGATLGGTGVVGGDVAVADGGTLAPGGAGAVPGTFGIGGSLTLGAGALLDYGFGEANVPGGPLNDLTVVAGDLTLDGTLNVAVSPGGSFDPGVYRVIGYGGALTDNGLALGAMPSDEVFVQTSIAGQVNLVNTAGLMLTYWDGAAGPKNDGVPNGGDGTWQASGGNDNWTEASGAVNAPWDDGGFAIFPTAAGTVTVDGSRGAVTASGMQFLTDGYLVTGDAVTLTGPSATIRVGDGSGAGAGYRATIAAELTGAAGLRKTDLGTLVLSGANSYAGGTALDGGAVEVAADASLGDAAGGLAFDGGTLRTTASFASGRTVTLGAGGGAIEPVAGSELTLGAAIGGSGGLTKAGGGTLTLTGDSNYAGGTVIATGSLRLGDGGASGSIAGDVENDGALVFDRSDAWSFGGAISGTGSVRQAGSGTTTLTGASSYAGVTTIAAGTLAAGATGVLSRDSAHAVAEGATLDLDGFSQRVARLSNAGEVNLGSDAGTRLTVRGGYIGAGGLLRLSTELGDDASRTDRLVVQGATQGDTTVAVTNAGGEGAATVEGIRVIEVAGASEGNFTLRGDYQIDGQQVVVAGAYGYTLQQGGVSDPADGDWYLRSTLASEPEPLPPLPPEPPSPPEPPIDPPSPPEPPIEPPSPLPPLFQPGVPVYQAYPATMLALNGLPTMQQRIGNRSWADGTLEDRRAWARIEGGRTHLEPDVATGADDWDLDTTKLQVGIDRPVWSDGDGLLVAGASFHYGQVDTDVDSAYGNGRVSTEGYGLGGSLTWLRGDGVYVDGQAEASWYDSDLHSAALGTDLADGNDGFGYAVGIEAGRRIALHGDWTLTPQGQIVYSSVGFDAFTDPLGARVSDDEGASLPARIGLSIDQERGWRDGGGERRSHLYAIANLEYQFLDETGVDVSGTALTAGGDRLWSSLGIGGTLSWNGGAQAIYGEGQVATSLSNFGDSTAGRATFGFRMAW